MSTPTRRRDASMTLLIEVMDRPLDAGYAAAAAEREAAGDPALVRRSERRRAPLTAVVGVLLGVLLAAAILQLRGPDDAADARTVLLEEIEARTATADALTERVEVLRGDIEQLQVQALSEEDEALLDLVQRLSVQAGAAPVTGPGVLVTMDDASEVPDPLAGDPRAEDTQEDRVVDLDVQIAVNGLWAAGAEAIAINGQRLTSLSAIRWAGGAILVGFRPLDPPYRIAAIGDPGMRTELAASDAGSYLAFIEDRYGLRVSIDAAEGLELPGAGPLQLRYADVPAPPAQEPLETAEVAP